MATPPPVRGLRIDDGLSFEFKPSIGIMAARVDKLGLEIRSFREPLKRSIQRVLAPSFKANFDAGGRPEPWAKLAEHTRTERQKEGFGADGPILVRTGLLKRTIQQFNIWSIDMQKAAIVDLPQKIQYGKAQQEGSIDRNLPARQFVMVQDQDYDGIQFVFEEWLQERIELARL